MLHKAPSIFPDHVQVTFELPAAIWADNVSIIGEFNNWSPDETPMHQARDDSWRAVIELPAGSTYTFCYLVDGRSMLEYPADGFKTDVNGTIYSIIVAELPTAAEERLYHLPLTA